MTGTVSTEGRKSVFVTLVEVMKPLAAASSSIFWICVTVWVIRVTMSDWVKSQESHCAIWPPSSFCPSMPNRDVTVLSIFLSGLWQKCLDVVVDIWRCQTKTRDKELQLIFFSRNKDQREVGTTVTIGPCVPIILYARRVASRENELGGEFCESVDASASFPNMLTHLPTKVKSLFNKHCDCSIKYRNYFHTMYSLPWWVILRTPTKKVFFRQTVSCKCHDQLR